MVKYVICKQEWLFLRVNETCAPAAVVGADWQMVQRQRGALLLGYLGHVIPKLRCPLPFSWFTNGRKEVKRGSVFCLVYPSLGCPECQSLLQRLKTQTRGIPDWRVEEQIAASKYSLFRTSANSGFKLRGWDAWKRFHNPTWICFASFLPQCKSCKWMQLRLQHCCIWT